MQGMRVLHTSWSFNARYVSVTYKLELECKVCECYIQVGASMQSMRVLHTSWSLNARFVSVTSKLELECKVYECYIRCNVTQDRTQCFIRHKENNRINKTIKLREGMNKNKGHTFR